VRLEGLGKLKKLIDFMQSRTHDLPACSIVPQPTTLPCVPGVNVHIHRFLISALVGGPRVQCNIKIKNMVLQFIKSICAI
jgi:hypothetical protein